MVRDREITDPAYMRNPPERFLAPVALDAAAAAIDPRMRSRGRGLQAPATPSGWRHRRRGPGGELHPERVLGVRLRRGAGGDRHPVAEPRFELQARRRRPQPPRAGPQAVPHPEPGPVSLRRRPHHALRHHGRRGPAPDPGRGADPLRVLRPASPGRNQRPAVAPRPNVGRGDEHDPETRVALRLRNRHRTGTRRAPRSRQSVHSTRGWATRARWCTIRTG